MLNYLHYTGCPMSNILRSILNSFYFKNMLKKILVKKFTLFKVTNKIGKINPILYGHKSVSYANIKLPHFPNT